MPVRVLATQVFHEFMESEGLTVQMLCKAVNEIEDGLIDARLGGFLVKKRVARPGRGKSKGFRTILAHRQGDRVFCLYGFAKNEQDNITKQERLALSELGDLYMRYSDRKLAEVLSDGVLIEVTCGGR
jgi:hypothetical protein